jgi:hypothetical protein
MGNVPNCPACRAYDVRVLSRCDDGLTSYVCHDCNKVFHVPEPPVKEREQFLGNPSDHAGIAHESCHRKVR